jgi:hypothetical protein
MTTSAFLEALGEDTSSTNVIFLTEGAYCRT